jgi:hypothetical protein
MLEYVFFHPRPYAEFIEFLRTRGIDPETESAEGSHEVRVPEDLDDALSDAIEERYDALMALNQELFEQEQAQDADNYHAAGVVVNLQDGSTVYADIDPRLLGRVMEVLTPQEFGQVVSAIADAVENPDTRTFCQRMRDQGGGSGQDG